MKRVVLVTLPTSTNRTPEECLGLEYLASETRTNGHEAILIDGWMNGMSILELANEIMRIYPDVVGISPSMDSIENSKTLTELLRDSGFRGQIVMGGIYASFEAKSIITELKNKIDAVITGEADVSFQNFLDTGSVQGVPGAVYLKDDSIIEEPRPCGIDDLDNLPFPARDSLSKVIELKTPSHVMGSRGCYGNCSFCSVACFQKFSSDKRWRARSAKSIVSELKELSNKGETMIKFIDDNWFGGANKSREFEIAKMIREEKLNIRFRLSLRVNDVSEELIRELKKSGLFAVSLGVESFVQRKLNDYNKGTTVSQNIKALEILENNKVFVQMGHIMFDPFITIPEIEEELKYLHKTSWSITKGICTQIFAAEGTKITERIRKEVGFTGKQGTNNLYQIIDTRAKLFYECIKPWAKRYSSLYDLVIDPISAPKNIPQEAHMAFHKLCLDLRRVDLEVAQLILERIKNKSLHDSNNVESEMFAFFGHRMIKIEKSAAQLYIQNNMNFETNTNKHIY